MNLKNRIFPAAVHLGVSLLVGALTWVLVSRFLYPYPFIEISGGRHLFLLLVAVDVVLGSVLTFSVFSSTKLRSVLMRDLIMIGMLQTAALGYGLWTLYTARPVYLVYEVDRFKVITAADVDKSDLSEAPPQFREFPIFGVQTIGIRGARDGEDKLRSLELELAGKELSLQTQWWQPLSEENRASMRQHGKPLMLLRQQAGDGGKEIDRILREAGLADADALVLPMVARMTTWTVVLDKRDLKSIGYWPIDLL
jgi:hypothetical protein